MLKRQIEAEFQNGNCSPPQKENALQREEIERQQKEQERQQKENALQRESKERQQKEKALAEVERLRALLQDKDSDPS